MVDSFLRKIKDAIVGPDSEQVDRDANYEDPRDDRANPGQFGKVRPAIEDPDGDPADYADAGQFGNVRPASADPYGDPADSYVADAGQFGNVTPASEDPYGDPADEEEFS